jgi:predicted site-specific integrase-resolvase
MGKYVRKTIAEAAEILGIHPQTLRRWARMSEIPPHPGWRWDRARGRRLAVYVPDSEEEETT